MSDFESIEMSDKSGQKAMAIVREYIRWHREASPMPTRGFPPEYFADDLVEAIANALRDAAQIDRHRPSHPNHHTKAE